VKMLNLHAQFMVAEDTADFRLLLSATDDRGNNVATIESFNIDDPNLQDKLRVVTQAFRMGARFGKEG
jgi:hypothetical protein